MTKAQKIAKIKKALEGINDKLIYGTVISPHLNDLATWFWCWKAEELTGLGNKFAISIYLNNAKEGYWIFDQSEYKTFADYMFKHQGEVLGHFRQWQKDIKKYYCLVNKFLTKGSSSWAEDYLALREAFAITFGRAAIIENVCMESDELLGQIKGRYGLTDRDLLALLQEPKQGFIGQNEQSLKNIALKAYALANRSYQKLPPEIKKLLDEHQQKFFWIENNYHDAKVISAQEFWKRARQLIKSHKKQGLRPKYNYETKVKQKKIRLKRKYKISQKDFKALEFLSLMTWWQDSRKASGLMMNHWATEFMQLTVQKYQVPFNDLRYLTSDEFVDFLKSGRYDKAEVKARQKRAIQIVFKSGKNYIVSGNGQLRKLIKALLAEDYKLKDSQLPGVVASRGKADKIRGRVRIVSNPKGIKLKPDEILVTSMTRPEYVPLMRQAAAIITDMGGITCHAAIASRELKKPCLMDTKIATKALKNGQLVEVDTNGGLVRVLKK